ncbi:hypothetical protein DRQ15_05320 [candidate division KSB1 bacterium]|nr:MAG: hypothetical protein DRQ15_05320 [candidate division KSB1 bacterium]
MINNGSIVKSLCSQCGVCIAFCPTQALRSKRDAYGLNFPSLIPSKCTLCGLCNKICPSYEFDNSSIKEIFNDQKRHPLLGYYIGSYYGFSNDESIRIKSSSGGIVPALLLYLLQKGEIDGAVVVLPNSDNPFMMQAVLTKESKDIRVAMGSKYCPVAFDSAIEQIRRDENLKRVAVVGLPCQIRGIRKAMLVDRNFRNKIHVLIGIYCKQTKDLRFTDYVLSRLGIKREDVHEINYRGEGWPGYIQVILKDGQQRLHPFSDVAISRTPWLNFNFSPLACLVCDDATAEYADISTGDAWLSEFESDSKGTSLFITRTPIGEEIVQNAVQDKIITAEPIQPEKVVESQYPKAIVFKKQNKYARIALLRLFDRRIPISMISKQKVSISELLDALWIFSIRYFFSLSVVLLLTSKSPAVVHKILAKIPLSLKRRY